MISRRLTFVVCLLAALPAAALVRDNALEDSRQFEIAPPVSRAVTLVVDETSQLGREAGEFLERRGGTWEFRVDPRTERAVLVQGSGIPVYPGRGNRLERAALDGRSMAVGALTPQGLEPLVRGFVESHAGLLAPARGELVFNAARSSVRDRGRLASIHYDWVVDGLPVEGAHLFVRLNSGNITQFGAPWVGATDVATTPTIDSARALDVVLTHAGDRGVFRLLREPELILQPREEGPGERLNYTLVWKVTYAVAQRLGTWEGRVDAHTGELLAFRDTNHYARVTGGVYPRTVYENNETVVPFPFAAVTVNGGGAVTDTAGSFGFSGGTAATGLNGQHVDTSCQDCTGPLQPTVERSTGIGLLALGVGGQNQQGNGFSTPADRNSFFHINQVRRIGEKWLPGLPWLDQSVPSNVNIDSVCNAVYNSGDNSVNFFIGGGGCNNTGEIADVIHHEWGHGLDIHTFPGDGASGEGTADVVAMHMSQSPLVGPGFNVNGNPVRNIDRLTSSRGLLTTANVGQKCPVFGTGGPLGYEVHCEGEIYGQTAWDLAQSLVAKHGYHTGWRTSERIFFTSLPDVGGYHPTLSVAPAYDAYINADDDDGNLANGTPNGQEIYDAFALHGIAGTPRSNSAPCVRPAQPAVQVVPACGSLQINWNAVPGVGHYEILRGEIRLQQAFFPLASVGAGVTGFTDAEVAPGVDYWYVVLAVAPSGCESTVENPVAARLTAQPVLSLSAASDDDTPRGNRSGSADPGEEVDLLLTLSNSGEIAATSVSGTIVSSTPGVTILEGGSTFPAIPAGGAATQELPLRFSTDDQQVACGDLLQFQFVPDEATGCAADSSYFSIRLGSFDGNEFVCDPTPACFVKPDFDGVDQALPGSSCAENVLTWNPASSNCTNAAITYNVYRSTVTGFAPGPVNQVVEGLTGTSLVDALLQPGQLYHYVVRAHDSRSGEEGNVDVQSVTAPTSPDIRPPVFDGLVSAVSGSGCGDTTLAWLPALETCNAPVSYEIYRSTDPFFVPSPATRIGSSLSTAFEDAGLPPGTDYTYLVRARDGAGNEGAGDVRLTTTANVLDLVRFQTDFEAGTAGWAVTTPNDATAGNWAYGNPDQTGYQTGDDASPDPGVNCWVTGLTPDPSNGDVDGGSTTLLTPTYNLSGAVDPVVRYWRYFNNDKGASPNDASDTFKIEISNNGGGAFINLEPPVACNTITPCSLEWVKVEIPLNGLITVSNKMRLRFTARDLGDGSLVEAGIDEVALLDRGQGCLACSGTPPQVGTISVNRVGDDVVVDWDADAVVAPRFAVYKLGGSEFSTPVKIGTTAARSFVHAGAALAAESFYYRVRAIDACGTEGEFSQPVP